MHTFSYHVVPTFTVHVNAITSFSIFYMTLSENIYVVTFKSKILKFTIVKGLFYSYCTIRNVYIEMQAKSEHRHKTFIIIRDNLAVRA